MRLQPNTGTLEPRLNVYWILRDIAYSNVPFFTHPTALRFGQSLGSELLHRYPFTVRCQRVFALLFVSYKAVVSLVLAWAVGFTYVWLLTVLKPFSYCLQQSLVQSAKHHVPRILIRIRYQAGLNTIRPHLTRIAFSLRDRRSTIEQ